MDYTYPSIFFAYLFFGLCVALGAYFLARSAKDGYWGKDGEDVKYRMLEDDDAQRRHHD